jgi:hypothetical protein
VRTDLDPVMMWDLSRRACGFLNADEAAQPSVRGVTSTQYAVRFQMLLTNVSDRSFVLENLTSPGLAVSVVGGLPLAVAPHSDVDLAVTVSLPACAPLPAPARRGRGVMPQFGTITLELRDDVGAQRSKPYLPEVDLSAALIGLRLRICPASSYPIGESAPPARALGQSPCPVTDVARVPGVDHANGAAERCP